MKDSLKFLNVCASGLEQSPRTNLNDEELFSKANEINDLKEKINFLKENIDDKKPGYIRSKRLLALLVKDSELELSCNLILSCSKHSLLDVENYLTFSQIALEHNAWEVAKSSLDAAIWLDSEKANSLLDLVVGKIDKKEKDNSNNKFWKNKQLNKYWILERLYLKGKTNESVDYAYKLLKVFPDDLKNYESVYKLLSLINDKKSFEDFIKYIENNKSLDDENKNLYLGKAYYAINEYDLSINLLLKANPKNADAKVYLSLCYLFTNKIQDFIKCFNTVLPDSKNITLGVFFIHSAFLDLKFKEKEFPNQKAISQEISKLVEKLFDEDMEKEANNLLAQFKKLNYHIVLPYLNLYLGELFIKKNKLNTAKELLKVSNDPERHRLYAWIYRLEGLNDQAEHELREYRKNLKPDVESSFNLVPVNITVKEDISNENICNVMNDIYDDTKKIIGEITLEYGLDLDTCIETTCQDCCTKTFPFISYVEYLYIKEWLEKQPQDVKLKIIENSKEIVHTYKEKYKKDPSFIYGDENTRKDYPNEFKFDCPNLGDNKCNIYEVRPFTCRAYSFCSSDGVSYKGCDYFYEQFRQATKLSNTRKVINMQSFFDFAKKASEKLIGKHVIAPIPVWFSMSHDEIIEKIKGRGNS